MKQLIFLLCCSGALACAADLETAKTVYVLSMSHGLDQYLANRLTNDHVLQVEMCIRDRAFDAIHVKSYGDAEKARARSEDGVSAVAEQGNIRAVQEEMAGGKERVGQRI